MTAIAIRTRFAPSPTGYLHIGGARTALFNYLFARRHGGKFVLRIEDTDVLRSTEESVGAILEGMRWLGLEWDEGPYYQSKRFPFYREHAEALLKKGLAYRCWCTPEELEERRNAAIKKGLKPMYDGRCRLRTEGPSQKPSAVRFKVPSGKTVINDLVKGTITFDHADIEDLVILRSDSTPTYNISVVVDDALMKITHVIRGDDHINNTPKQILLYNAMGYDLPEFAHLPMILGSDKTRLSKRHGATSVMAYKEMGYLPHALVNYLARLGWAHGDQEIFTMGELIEKFSLSQVGRSAGVFNPEKLLWLNHHYIKQSPTEELSGLVLPFLKDCGIDAKGDGRLPLIINTVKERSKTLKEMCDAAAFYFKDEITYDEKPGAGIMPAKKFLPPEKRELLRSLMERLEGVEPFGRELIEKAFNGLLSEKNLPLSALAQPVRVALTGSTISPGIFETIEAMGKALTIKRLKKACELMESAT